jgi:hypothetical protein
MSRPTLVRCLALAGTVLLVACAAYQAQHSGGGSAPAGHDHGSAILAPSAEFTELPGDEQIARVRGEAGEAKRRLAAQGKYACCVRPACNQCLHKYGECHCREVAQKQGPCCGECTEAWIEGRGAIEGVTAWELLERKKAMLDEANPKPVLEDEHQHHEEEKPPR